MALHTDVPVGTVHSVIFRYNRFGSEAIEGREHSIRRRCYLSKDEETELLKLFLEIAPTGEICVAGPIKHALEELLGRLVHHFTVYRMLHRIGWREIVPRPAHPEAKEETQEAFKKAILVQKGKAVAVISLPTHTRMSYNDPRLALSQSPESPTSSSSALHPCTHTMSAHDA